MSFPSERIEVPFARTRIGNLEIVIVSPERHEVNGPVTPEEEIERQLADEGLIRLPPSNLNPIEEFKRVHVGGKPMSEMIIEERR
ncbi:MAG: hypothetical protein WAM70_11590 [Pyrinomonadaceae bacterium]